MLQDLDATPESVITVKALGLSPPAKPLGYEGVAFYLPTAQRDNIEMIVSDVGEEANWKMCANANTDKSQTSAKVKSFELSGATHSHQFPYCLIGFLLVCLGPSQMGCRVSDI